MRVIQTAPELEPGPRKVCAAIGVFDGVHLGHQQVIRQTVTDARQQEGVALVVTFDRHPNAIVAPDRAPPLIYSLPQRLRAVAELGVDATWLIHFDKAFSEQTGEEFIRGVARDLGHLHSICVGSTFTFGRRRSGDVSLLKTLGAELGFSVHGLAAVSLDGRGVSSTRIREAIRSGQLDAACQMLGRAYSLTGLVARGDQLGRKLGFPTANLDATGLVLPPNGVYAAHALVHGRSYRAVLNIGCRPTLRQPSPSLHVEAHLLDFSGELYDQPLELSFVAKLRDEQTFSSLAELQSQIGRDIELACSLFGDKPS